MQVGAARFVHAVTDRPANAACSVKNGLPSCDDSVNACMGSPVAARTLRVHRPRLDRAGARTGRPASAARSASRSRRDPFELTIRRAGRRLIAVAGSCGWPTAPSTTTSSSSPRAWWRARSWLRRARLPAEVLDGFADGVDAGARRCDGGRRARLEVARARRPRRTARARARAARRCASRSTGAGARTSASSASARATAPRSTRPAGSSSSAPIAATPAPTARPRCSPTAASRRATARRCRGCSPAAATRPGSQTDANGTRFDLGGERRRSRRARPPGRCACSSSRDPTPAARLRAFCRRTGLPGAAAGVGLRASGRAATSTSTRTTCSRTSTGYRAHRHPARRDRARLALGDAIQHVGVQPAPVPGRAGADRPDARATGVRTVVWVDAVGQPRLARRPGPARSPSPSACTASRRPTTRRAPPAGTSSRDGTASRSSRSGGWAPARRSTSPARPPRSGGASRPAACSSWASRGSRPTTARATTSPTTCGSPTAAAAPRRAWALGGLAPRVDAARARRGPPGRAACCSAAAAGPASRPSGHHLGRRPGVGLLVAARAGRGDAVGGLQRHLELVARRRRLPRPSPGRALPAGAARALAPVRLLHAADARARADAAGALALQRAGARALPRLRAAARAARPVRARGGGDRGAHRAADHPPAVPDRSRPTRAAGRSPTPTATGPRCGSRRCSRTARASARSRCRAASGSRRGRGGASVAAAEVVVEAPLERIPVWVRRGLDRRHLSGRARCGGSRRRARVRAPAGGHAVGPAAAWAHRRAAGRRHPDLVAGGAVVGAGPGGRGPSAGDRVPGVRGVAVQGPAVRRADAARPGGEPAHDVGGGRLVATVTDPDGNVLGLLRDR